MPDVLEYLREQKEHPDHYILYLLALSVSTLKSCLTTMWNVMTCVRNWGEPSSSTNAKYDSRLIDALVNTVRANEHQEFKEFLPEEETL